MGCGVAVAAAAAVAAGTQAYSASAAAGSAQDAQNANNANAKATNAANYALYQQERGSTGNAIYPVYAAGSEQGLYANAANAIQQTTNLAPTAQSLQDIQSSVAPMTAQAQNTASGIFNGNTQTQELANQVPVSNATTNVATAQNQGTLEALQQTLNNIKSIQAGKGFAGDSYGSQLLNFQARQGANTNLANNLAQANLTNARANQGIQQNAINRQINNIGLPTAVAQQDVSMANLPANSITQQAENQQGILQNFKIGVGNYQQNPMPNQVAIPSTGQIVGSGIGSLASGVGNYAALSSLTEGAGGSGGSNLGSHAPDFGAGSSAY